MDASVIRNAIIESLPSDTSLSGGAPRREWIYLPFAHGKALRLENSLVIGGRGVGKTFWWAALQDSGIRESLSRSSPELLNFDVAPGHGEKPDISSYPEMETFGNLIDDGHKPFHVWRAVAARWIGKVLGKDIPVEIWDQTVAWVEDNPESFSKIMEHADSHFKKIQRHGLIVFDALDRSSRDWRIMDEIVRDLLHFVLYLKPFGNLHAKVFLREDQFEGRNVRNFPDASKLLATRVDLTWGFYDLHGLLWQYLINGADEHGVTMRSLFERETRLKMNEESGLFRLPDEVRRDEDLQRGLFVELAGEWMGTGPRRGRPYTWVVSHLADGRGRVSPRSFIAAIRSAAENAQERYSEHKYPLHYESIKHGVQEASRIRVDELGEDYPWIKSLMATLEGLTVPCHFSEIERRWADSRSLDKNNYSGERLPPEHLDEGSEGVRRNLESLGVFERMRDGRVNMPDLYRVGFRLGRKGGVRPVIRKS